jgi:hypothetical protein
MTLHELVKFEVRSRGVNIKALAVNCKVSVYTIGRILEDERVDICSQEKVAFYFGYAVETKLVRLIEGKE